MNGDAQGGPSCHASAETRGMNGHLQGVSLTRLRLRPTRCISGVSEDAA